MNRTPRLTALLTALVSAALLAGCGGDDSADSTPKPGTAESGADPIGVDGGDAVPVDPELPHPDPEFPSASLTFERGDLPSDAEGFLGYVAAGKLQPIADWSRHGEPVDAPPFGQMPPLDVDNPVPAGKEAWNTPVDGGTLIVQYNSGPKNINRIVENSAVTHYITDLTNARISHQNMVTFKYGKPNVEDPKRIHDSVDGRDCASGWVIEESLRRADGSIAAFGKIEDAGESWTVTPIRPLDGEERVSGSVEKMAGDRVLEATVWTVTLRPGVKWHDGEPLTASDVEFSVQVIQNDTVNSDNVRSYFADVESCKALDTHVVRWVLVKPYLVSPSIPPARSSPGSSTPTRP
ncbi:MAG: ABC transporter substrate-binding protein [Planctomycetota bacterium]|jgi:ABC-type transport system substrate-binding protein